MLVMRQKKARALRALFLTITIVFGTLALLWLAMRIAYSNMTGIDHIKAVIENAVDISKVIQIGDICAWISGGISIIFLYLTIWIDQMYIIKYVK